MIFFYSDIAYCLSVSSAWPRSWPWIQTAGFYSSSVQFCKEFMRVNKSVNMPGRRLFRRRAEKQWVVFTKVKEREAGSSDCTSQLRLSVMDPAASCLCHLSRITVAVSLLSAQTDTEGHEGWWAVSGSIKDLLGRPWKMKPSLNR